MSGAEGEINQDEVKDQLRELRDETGRLYKLLGERDLELRKLRNKPAPLPEVIALDASGDVASGKIVQLSKRVRELTAELEAERSKTKQFQKKCMDLESELRRKSTDGDKISDEAIKTSPEVDSKVLLERLRQSEMKAADLRNQCQALRQELKVAHKALNCEVGDGFNAQQILINPGSWRGRAEQIAALQKKINELRDQPKPKLDPDDLDSSGSMGTVRSSMADDKMKIKLRKMEKEKKEHTERISREFKALEGDYEDAKMKLEACKARNKTLTGEVRSLKDQLKTLLEKGRHDDELVQALLKQQKQLRKAMVSSTKENSGRSIAKEEQQLAEELRSLVGEKEAKVKQLEREVSLLRIKYTNSASDKESSSETKPKTELPLTRLQQAQVPEEVLLQFTEAVSLHQASQVERDRLAELTLILQQRVTEANERIRLLEAEVQSLKKENALQDKRAAARQKPESSGKKKSNEIVQERPEDGSSVEELHMSLAIQRDENHSLKMALQSTLEAKEEDLKLYYRAIEETRNIFVQSLRQHATDMPVLNLDSGI